MKKWLLATSIAFLGTTAVVSSDLTSIGLEAQAKSYPISKNFAQNLKEGKLPRSKGSVGMTYKAFSKKVGKQFSLKGRSYEDKSVATSLNQSDYYSFSSSNKNTAKIISISRTYEYVLDDNSFNKYFGKCYKGIDTFGFTGFTYIRKAGKRYFHHDYGFFTPEGQSFITVGTKKEVMKAGRTEYVKIYR